MVNVNLLHYIKEGMEVYDFDGEKVGTVSFVKLGDTDAEWRLSYPDEVADEVDAFTRTLADNYPIEEHEHLIQEGFVKVTTGLLFPDRYILPDQIEEVTDTRVALNASYSDLLA